jgi:hypothetical protein
MASNSRRRRSSGTAASLGASASAAASVAESVPVDVPRRRDSFSAAGIRPPPDTVELSAYHSLERWMTAVATEPRMYHTSSNENIYDFFKVANFEELYALLIDIIEYTDGTSMNPRPFNRDIVHFLNNIGNITEGGITYSFYLVYTSKIGLGGKPLGKGFSIYKTINKRIDSTFFELFIRSADTIEVVANGVSRNLCSAKKSAYNMRRANNVVADKMCALQGGSRKRCSKKRRSKKRRALRKTK